DSAFYRTIFPAGAYYGSWFWLSVPAFLFNWFLIFMPSWAYSVHWMLLWSLSIEEQFYLLYPFALKKLRGSKALVALLLAVIVLALIWRTVFFFYDRSNDFIQSFPSTSKFDLIAIGVLLFLAVRHYGKALSRNPAASWALCVAGALLSLAVYFGTQENNHWDEIYSSDLLGLGIFAFLLGGLHLPLFEHPYWKVLAMPGKYCYGCYMLHPFVLLFMGSWLHSLNVFLGFSLFIVATTLLGASSFHLFETPVNLWFRRKFAGRPSP
ncbi:MAG TPA: acyltransferase, partial [bacterium]|nr:acyltransferase [bacterium]